MPIVGSRGLTPRSYGFGGAGKPNAPVSVSATDVGSGRAYNNGRADVSFTSGGDNGAPISSFTVTSSPGGFTASGVSSPITITGLQSSVQYTYTVTATNTVGTSNASSASAGVTATTVPQSPTIGTSTAGSGSATVTYTANATGGSTVTAYTATSSPGSFTGTGTSPITVSGLTNGTAYTFTVTATNANGTSSASSASNSVTPLGHYAAALYSSTDTEQGYYTTSDSSGNTYIGYNTYVSSVASVGIAKYNSSGTLQWQKKLTNSNVLTYYDVQQIEVASNGDVYITGFAGKINPGDKGYITKLNSSGTMQWTRTIVNSSPGTNSSIDAIAIDSSDNVYAAGKAYDGSFDRLILYKINSSGTTLIQKGYTTPWFISPTKIFIDSSGDILVAGRGSNGNPVRGFLAKISANLETIYWSTLRNDPSGSSLQYESVWSDSSNNAYVVGSVGNGLNYIAKFNSSGTLQWEKTIDALGSANSNSDTPSGGIYGDSSGNIYIAGTNTTVNASKGVSAQYAGFVAKYDSSGTNQFTRSISTSVAGSFANYGVEIDVAGRMVMGGYQSQNSGGTSTDTLLLVLPSDGTKTGSFTVGGRGFSYASATSTETSITTNSTTPTLTANAGSPTMTTETFSAPDGASSAETITL